jgi:high-affinity iron transporter
MFAAYLIMLREGIEAALIVGIVAGYLKQSGRVQWLPMVWIGVGLACLLCLIVGAALNAANREFPQSQQEMFEGFVALFATAILEEYVNPLRGGYFFVLPGVQSEGAFPGEGLIGATA